MVSKLVCGVGMNDSGYAVQPVVSGRQVACKFYQTWLNMLKRCYSPASRARFPTYLNCHVCSDWLIFSNFKSWMETQDWQGKSLDKDILIAGNKCYSPYFCVFLTINTNTFIIDSLSSRGDLPLGVDYDKSNKKYRARCRNPFTNKSEHIGRFTCQQDAHLAWKKRKHELACQLAEIQDDPKVAQALRTRYA